MVKKQKKTKSEKLIGMQLVKVLGFFVFLVILFFMASWIFDKMSHVEYKGLTFTKEKVGKLIFYHYSYFFEGVGKKTTQYNLYLRYNPKLNSVRVYGDSPLKLDSKNVLMGIDASNLVECKGSMAGIGSLSGFLKDNGIKVSAGNFNKSDASLNNQQFISCETNPDKDVILVLRGNESRVDIGENCFKITIGDSCNVLETVEKFQTRMILDSKVRP